MALLVLELLGVIAVLGVVGASGSPWWQLVEPMSILATISFGTAIVAFVLATIGTATAIRRQTQTWEAVLALAVSFVLTVWMFSQIT